MFKIAGAVAVALGFTACGDPPTAPPEPWGTYNYEAIGFDGGWLELTPDGGNCEIIRFDVGAWPCIVTDVGWTDDTIDFRFAASDSATYFYQHEGTVNDGSIAGS